MELFDNQFVVLQSIFLVDTEEKVYCSARTWGQFITGKFQNAIASGIEQLSYEPA